MMDTRYVADGLSWSQRIVREPSLAATSETSRPLETAVMPLGTVATTSHVILSLGKS
jgi:hypothetical protein